MSRLFKIAAREYVSYVRTLGFWLSMLLMPVVGTLGFTAPMLLERGAPPPSIAVIDQTGLGFRDVVVERLTEARGGKPTARVVEAPIPPGADVASTLKTLMGGEGDEESTLSSAVVIKGAGEAITIDYWSNNLLDRTLERQVTSAVSDAMRDRRLLSLGVDHAALTAAQALEPKVASYSPKTAAQREVGLRDRLPGIVGFAAALLLWSMVLTGAGILLNSVVEDKSSRVLEVLLASASVPEIMFGKILGVLGVTLTVLTVWGVVGGVLAAVMIPAAAADVASVLFGQGLIFYFGFYLVGGYLLYAAIFTAVGAFCETTREAQTLLGPVMTLLIIPVVFMSQAIRRPDAPILEILSWIPPFTPFLMTARAAGQPPLWEVVGTGVLMLATVGVVVWLSGRAFRAGALSTGKVDFKGLLATLRRAD